MTYDRPVTSPRALSEYGRGALLATGFLAFLAIGAVQALYGPAFETFQARFGIDAQTVSWIVSAHFLGSFTTIALSGLLIARFGYRRPLVAANLALALGAFAIALSPTWPLTLLGALLVGLGFGVVDIGTNLLFARSFGVRGAPALNLLNALFGVGAVMGPLLILFFLPSVAWPFAILGVVALSVAGLALRLRDPPPPDTGERLRISFSRVIGFVLFYFIYVAAEVGVASWEPKQLTPRFGEEWAALYVSIYWGAITVGRFIAAPLSARLRPRRLVLGASALAFAAALFTYQPALAPYAYALVGLAFAPIFPTGLIWLQETFPQRAEQIAPIAIAAANLSPVLTSPLIGRSVDRGGVEVIPTLMVGLIGLLLVVTAGLAWRTRS